MQHNYLLPMDIPVEDHQGNAVLHHFVERLLRHSPGGLKLDSVLHTLQMCPQWPQLRPSEILID